jgi:hypothetical protein
MKSPCWLVGMIFVLLLFAGCGSSNNRIATSIPKATTTPVPTATPTLDPSIVAHICGNSFPASTQYSQFGDLVLKKPEPGFLTLPGFKLPDDLSLDHPYQVTEAQVTNGNPQTPDLVLANPGSKGTTRYEIYICNISTTQSYTLQSGVAQIPSVAPDTSANLNVQIGCDGPFSSKTRRGSGGCGGAFAGTRNSFAVTWPDNVQSGTVASRVTQVSGEGDPDATPMPYLPLTLKPGTVYHMEFDMDYPAINGTYTFQFGIHTDKGLALSPASDPVFLAKNAHQWSGDCSAPAFLSQIPSTGPEQFYLCPVTK